MPQFQLKPPSLLQPSDPLARFNIGIGQQMKLDADLRAKMLPLAWDELDPDCVKPQRLATGGGAFSALTQLPQVSGLLGPVRDDALARLSRDRQASSTGENVAPVGAGVFVAGNVLTEAQRVSNRFGDAP